MGFFFLVTLHLFLSELVANAMHVSFKFQIRLSLLTNLFWSSSAFRLWKYGLTLSSVIVSCLMAAVYSEVLKLWSSCLFLYSLHYLSSVFKRCIPFIGYIVGTAKKIGFWKFNFVASLTNFYSSSSVRLLLQKIGLFLETPSHNLVCRKLCLNAALIFIRIIFYLNTN